MQKPRLDSYESLTVVEFFGEVNTTTIRYGVRGLGGDKLVVQLVAGRIQNPKIRSSNPDDDLLGRTQYTRVRFSRIIAQVNIGFHFFHGRKNLAGAKARKSTQLGGR